MAENVVGEFKGNVFVLKRRGKWEAPAKEIIPEHFPIQFTSCLPQWDLSLVNGSCYRA